MFQTAHKNRKFVFFLIPVTIFLIWSQITNSGSDQKIDEFPIVFYHQAYVDFRFTPPKLRVFSLNPCLRNESFLLVKLSFGTGTFEFLHLKPEPIEPECPWLWAPSCHYNSYVFHAPLTNNILSRIETIDKVSILLGGRAIQLNLHFSNRKKKKGLTVCVQPVYWYTQFQNIVLFIEAWRSHGANNFVIYFHSSTKEVRLVLDYYAQLINSQTYRIAHTLAMNLCLLEMETEIGTFVDFDEVIVPPNGSLLPYAQIQLREEGVGALEFRHSLVNIKLSQDTMMFDREGLLNPISLDKNGPPKVVFNTSMVDVILTHNVRRFIGKGRTVKARGALFHNRYNSANKGLKRRNSTLRIFRNTKIGEHLKNMEVVMNSLNKENESRMSFNSSIIVELNKCIEEMRQSGECRSAVVKCRHSMSRLAEWHYDTTPDIFIH